MTKQAAKDQTQQVQQSDVDSAMAQADTFSGIIDVILNKLGSWWQSTVEMIPNFAVAILVMIGTFILASILGRFLQRFAGRVVDSEALANLLTAILKTALICIGFFASLSLLSLDKTVTSLLAGLGIVGLAIGFAFQDVAANFLAGVFMSMRKPFKPDDLVRSKGYLGFVKSLNLRNTVIENFTGQRIIIPNKEVFQSPLENYSVTEYRRVDVDVGVSYDSDLAQVEQVLRDAADGLSWRTEDKEVSVWCLKFDASAISWKVGVWMKYPGDTVYYDAKHEAHLAIKKALDEADIIIPLPIRTLHIPDRTIDRLLPHEQQHDKERDKEKSNDFDQNHRSDRPRQEGSDRDSTGDSGDGDEDGES
ncbi:mechanosensitive ion channel family protein [Zhongshania sp.]|jgi:small-conductance mechanosensitive channel|uniref:mechanosensitive ion channel family protein n=1 Tax=Zhongshania sp. TaxID=1971902 RepID=UPI002A83E219|nr:mechanosensitive ion channel family protein [Zhongshania sp.]